MCSLSALSAGKRWGLVLGAVFVGLIAAVLVCEAPGWPFLVGPLQHKLASALDRKIDFGSDTQAVQIRLLGSVRVRAARKRANQSSSSRD